MKISSFVNELGALTLLLSGAMLAFALVMVLIGFNFRQLRIVFKSLFLQLFWPRLDRALARGLHIALRKISSFLFKNSERPASAIALALARQALYANALLTALAMALLCILMIQLDLRNMYVVNNSALDLPLFYRITGSWAGSAGSLLFWYCLLAIFSATCLYFSSRRASGRLPHLIFVLIVGQALFALLNIFFDDAQPFRVYPNALESGRGINPLLLHWGMIIHPPILYVGYVGFAIPFALVLSALLSGKLQDDYLPALRRWTIFAWFFLGTGILLGSKWAYEELGWGGYWAWDPVENASLMPFLFGTAFLHSLIVQERRSMLRFWNVFLIIMAYHFCLLGTWITRSGVLEGPHSFAESSIGKPFIIYLLLSLLFSLRFLYIRRAHLRPAGGMEAITSKEGSMLFNNLVMTISVLIILFGVFSQRLPFDCRFEDGFKCFATEWKPAAYNRIMIPIGLFTLFLMGASPLLTWRKGAHTIFWKSLFWPLTLGAAGAISFFFFSPGIYPHYLNAAGEIYGESDSDLDRFMAALAIGLCLFTIAGLFKEYFPAIKLRQGRYGERFFVAFWRVVLRNKRRYGGYLVHLSVVFLFIGYSGSAFKTTDQLKFQYYLSTGAGNSPYIHYRSNDRAFVKGYEVTAADMFFKTERKTDLEINNPVHFTTAQSAHLFVREQNMPRQPAERHEGDPLQLSERKSAFWNNLLKFSTGFILDGRMRTERHFHPRINPLAGSVERRPDGSAVRIPTSKPDIRSTWSEDLYIQLGSIMDAETGQNLDWNHIFEYYYFFTDRSSQSRSQLFPYSLVATIEVWVNPLVKFIWLGSLLFFLGGMILWLPFGEKKLESFHD